MRKINPERLEAGWSDPVDLDEGLVALAAAAPDDEGGYDDGCDDDGAEHGRVFGGGLGLVDGVDEFESFGLEIFSSYRHFASSKRPGRPDRLLRLR